MMTKNSETTALCHHMPGPFVWEMHIGLAMPIGIQKTMAMMEMGSGHHCDEKTSDKTS